jgi:membrane protease YdiL (CAAX protease family)
VLAWLFLALFASLQQATGILPPQIGLAQWGPGVAALLMLVIFRKDGFKITFFSRDTPGLRYLYAVLIPVAAGLVVFLIRSLIPMESSVPEAYNKMVLVLLWTPLGALGEELGWRGYLHKKLNTRLRGLLSSVLVGILWMLIHVTFLTQGPIILIFLAVWFISLSIVMFALVQDTGFSVLLATLFHLTVNLMNLLIIDVIYEAAFWIINGIVWGILATVVVLTRREIFSFSTGKQP